MARGLLEAIDILKRVEGLTFVHFDESDVVRHHLVQRIVRAYDEHKARATEQMLLLPKPAEAPAVSDKRAAAPAGEVKAAPASEVKAAPAEIKG